MDKISLLFATAFGAGYLPVAPGTWGALEGLLIYGTLFRSFSPWLFLLLLVPFVFFSVFVSTRTEKVFGIKDPGCIVIDEVVGMMITLVFIPWTWKTALAGFILFRVFDIVKPFPVRWFQDHFPAGWGVMLDDVVAGIMANALLQIAWRTTGSFFF